MTEEVNAPATQRPVLGVYVDASGNHQPCVVVKIYADQSADLYYFSQAGAGVTWVAAAPSEKPDSGIVSSWYTSDI